VGFVLITFRRQTKQLGGSKSNNSWKYDWQQSHHSRTKFIVSQHSKQKRIQDQGEIKVDCFDIPHSATLVLKQIPHQRSQWRGTGMSFAISKGSAAKKDSQCKHKAIMMCPRLKNKHIMKNITSVLCKPSLITQEDGARLSS
jgi:hypothetical protein